MFNIELLIEQLKSWGSSYIPPSAQITMDEASKTIIAMHQEIMKLQAEIETLKSQPMVDDPELPKDIKVLSKAQAKPRTRKALAK